MAMSTDTSPVSAGSTSRQPAPPRTASGLVLSLFIASIITVAGCAGGSTEPGVAGVPGSASSAGTSDTAAGSPVAPAQSLIAEIDRELGAMRSTRYQHTTLVDEGRGSFMYDCSGLLDYALGRVAPGAVGVLPTSTSARPLAGDIERYLHRGLTGPIGGWQALPRVDQLRPGDVIAWQATEDSRTGDTGHVMVVHATPVPNPARPHEWLVQVADSTLNPHALDSRKPAETGLGTGRIGLVVDEQGAATAFYWRGAISEHAKATEISLGRLT